MGGSVPATAEELQADAYEEAKAAADQMIQALDASLTDIQMTVYLDKDGVLILSPGLHCNKRRDHRQRRRQPDRSH